MVLFPYFILFFSLFSSSFLFSLRLFRILKSHLPDDLTTPQPVHSGRIDKTTDRLHDRWRSSPPDACFGSTGWMHRSFVISRIDHPPPRMTLVGRYLMMMMPRLNWPIRINWVVLSSHLKLGWLILQNIGLYKFILCYPILHMYIHYVLLQNEVQSGPY